MTTHYEQLRRYCDDLTERVRLRDEWRLRHPDCNTQVFIDEKAWWDNGEMGQYQPGDPNGPTGAYYHNDLWSYYEGKTIQLESSFNPHDPEPYTQDILTADTFLNLMTIALSAYERLAKEEK